MNRFCFLQTLQGGERHVISSSLECQTKLRVSEQNEGLARIETYDIMQFVFPFVVCGTLSHAWPLILKP